MNKTQKPMHQRRVNWLKKNRSIWDGYHQDLPHAHVIERQLLTLMKDRNLYPPGTTILDVSFSYLINKARGKRGITFGKKKQNKAKAKTD